MVVVGWVGVVFLFKPNLTEMENKKNTLKKKKPQKHQQLRPSDCLHQRGRVQARRD
jgi:hypothetical protein